MASKKIAEVVVPEPPKLADASERWDMNWEDVKKILKGAGIAFGGAALFSILTWLQIWFGSGMVDWNNFLNTFWLSCLPAAISVGINAVMKWIAGQPKE